MATFPSARFLVLLLVPLAVVVDRAEAASRAIIAVGLTTSETQAARLRAQAETVRQGFIARGFPADAVTVIGAAPGSAPVKRETILAALAPAPAAGPTPPGAADETWVVLFGTIAPGREGQPAFQVSGPRLSAGDFATAVGALPGKKFVVVVAANSGGFLPALLKLPEVEAAAATADAGEIGEPRFGEFWAEALVARPHATFVELAAAAAVRVEAFYKQNKIGQSEHARMLDRATGKIVEAPFALPETQAVAAASAARANDPRAAPIDISAIEIPKPKDDLDIERRPATDETRAMIEAARAAAAGSPHAAIMLATEVELTIGRDFSAVEKWKTRTYVRTGEALDDVATFRLPFDPPYTLGSMDAARVIRPDGAQVIVNPRPLEARAKGAGDGDDDKAGPTPAPGGQPARRSRLAQPSGPPFIELPEVSAGCVVEVAWTIDRRTSGELPEFFHEWHFAEKYPQRAVRISVTTPREERWRVFAPNFSAKADSPVATPGAVAVPAAGAPAVGTETATTRTHAWTLTELPAFEPLPGDAPAKTFAPWLGVSSLPSWEAFGAWYRRLAAGSEESGPDVAALAAEIGAAHATRRARLQAAYERVAALRYVAIELGVGAFRPRTPEQVWRQRYGDCKDKANLLAAVLRPLGIAAEFALVNRGSATFTEFPGWQFNHALVRVPAAPAEGQATDLWLDTTDRLVPFGVVAPGDLGRAAMVFPRTGAAGFAKIEAAQEPRSEWREMWKLSKDGAGTRHSGNVVLTADGAADAMLRHLFSGLTPAGRAARLHDVLDASGLTVGAVSAGDAYDLATPFTVEATVSVERRESILPRPPGFAAVFAPASRTRPVVFSEGRAWSYAQEIVWGDAPAVYRDDVDLEAGGVTFSRAGGDRARRVKISGEARTLAPEKYPLARETWLTFRSLLSSDSPKTP